MRIALLVLLNMLFAAIVALYVAWLVVAVVISASLRKWAVIRYRSTRGAKAQDP
ncbi:MAG: hypothetical protein M3323_00835 [Actinomycetota bacterium]|nr:hypothetical protein [Actinomycetota bacterium]